jgi:hypothetical protein
MRNRPLVFGLNLLVLAVSFGSCGGGDSGGGSCGKVEPCGGDIKGQWTVATSCADSAALTAQIPPALSAMCPAAKVTTADVSTTGSYTFNADLTYSTMLSQTGTGTVNVPQSCLSGLTCPLLTAAIQVAMIQSPVPGIQSVTCAGTSDCVCTIVPAPVTSNEAGTYTTSGNMLTTSPTGGASLSKSYCVQGSTTLHFMTLDRTTNTGPGGQATITADIVARKK